jgi:hypothetical protein
MLIMYDKAMQKRVAPWTEEPVYAESDLESWNVFRTLGLQL